jgi:hypothetical protein
VTFSYTTRAPFLVGLFNCLVLTLSLLIAAALVLPLWVWDCWLRPLAGWGRGRVKRMM